MRDATFDLVVSALALQFVNDLPGVLVQIRRALKPDGLFLAALLGGETLTELRQSFAAAESEVEGGVSPRVAPFADLRDLGALLQRAGFALPVTDVDRLTVRYDSAFALMGDLRRMGATNALDDPPPPAAQARDAPSHGRDLRAALCRRRRPHRARRSRSFGYRVGRRIRASSSRSNPARRKRGSPTRSARGKFQPERKRAADAGGVTSTS